jgi:hypothetical protein
MSGTAGHAGPVPGYQLTLPLGISFFIFHSMSYTIDVYRGQVTPTRSLIDYACYVLMFPQLVAGPIVRFSYLRPHHCDPVVRARPFCTRKWCYSKNSERACAALLPAVYVQV